MVTLSESLVFTGPEGALVKVTSHRPGDDDQFVHIRGWAPISTFLASPPGKAARATGDSKGRVPGPVEVRWEPVTILVDGQGTPFEMCDLGDGYWAAVGRVPGATLTIDGRRVPPSGVRLERLASREPPAPPAPDLGERTATVINGLDERFARVPFARVHGRADFWALRAVEVDHVDRLARREGLSGHQIQALQAYWLGRVEGALRKAEDGRRFEHVEALLRSRLARRLGTGFLFQLWFNTVGPGARTWFGNRYSGIRHYTFRLRWRP
jgi:hypothetical protein